MQKKFSYLVLILVIFNLSIWKDNFDFFVLSKDLEISFLDVGQGDSVLIKTPNQKFVLIDAGKSNTSIGKIPKYVKEFEAVILSHPDADHIEGFIEVLRHYKVNNIIVNKTFKENEITNKIKSEINDYNIKNLQVYSINDFMIDEVTFDILWPDEIIPSNEGIESNDLSISILLSYRDFDFFTAGDLSSSYEDSLLDEIDTTGKEIELLKLSHHGSKFSSSEKFLAHLKPKLAVVSAGKDNSYGHPSKDVLERLDKLGIKYMSTIDLGSIKVSSDGKEFMTND